MAKQPSVASVSVLVLLHKCLNDLLHFIKGAEIVNEGVAFSSILNLVCIVFNIWSSIHSFFRRTCRYEGHR